MRATLMFKLPQTVRSLVLSFPFLALSCVHSLKKKRASALIRSSARLIHKVTAGSSSTFILSSVWLPPPLFPPLSLSLSLFQQMVKSQCCQDGQWHSFIVLLFSPHVCLSFPLSFHLCLLEGRSRCLSSPPPSLGG